MSLLTKNKITLIIAAFIFMNGCALKKMVKMAKDQQLTVTPNPLEVHGDSVAFDMSALLPLKMLKKNKIYSINTYYKNGDEKVNLGVVEFVSTDYPNAKTEQPKIQKHFSFFYKPEIGNGDLAVIGTASNLAKTKEKSTDEFPVAKGIITTSRLVKDYTYVAYADHGYNNKEELVPTIVSFYFDQGSAKLKTSETNSKKSKNLDAFIAKKNVTRTVTIVGNHSPEGTETINGKLADQRSAAIKDYTVKRMKHFNYATAVDSINFVTKGIVQDWDLLKKYLDSSSLDADQKSQVLNIVNGAGTFEEKEKQIQKLSFYKKSLLNGVYPMLRVARTEILTVKQKKTDAQISLLAKQIAEGTVKYDTLNDQELAYAATLTPILSEKAAIYTAATKKSDSWVAHNNLGAVYVEMAKKEVDVNERAKILDKAINHLEISLKKQDNAEAHINLASVHLIRMVRDKSREQLMKAAEMQTSDANKKGVNGMLGVLDIKDGKYDNAIQNLSKSTDSSEVVYNLALASLLKKDFGPAKSGFEKAISKAPNDAWGYYLAAVTAARMKDEGTVTANIKKAVKLNSKLVDKALSDLEFIEYWNSDNFKNALK